MSALGPHSLGAACRTIYDRAAEGNILPALIRDAANPEPPHRRIEASGHGFSIIFNVLYAEPDSGAPGRLAEPPLRFDIEAKTSDDGVAVELSARDRFELIRAFLLGVREPLAVDAPADGAGWRVAIRLSARFVMWSPAPVRLDDRFSATTICERLAARALETTQALFGSRAEGLEVWEVRLREELFGEPPLSAYDIWPVETPVALPAADMSEPIASPPARPAAARPAPRRRALAAAIALVGLAALAGAIARRGDQAQVLARDPVRLSQVGASPAVGSERRIAEAPLPAPIRVASVDERAALSPVAVDTRFAALAPAVALASRELSQPGAAPAPAAEVPPKHATADRSAKPAPHAAKTPAAHGHPGKHKAHVRNRPLPFARVDRTVRKFVRSVAARLPRLKISALNSPHAAGPR